MALASDPVERFMERRGIRGEDGFYIDDFAAQTLKIFCTTSVRDTTYFEVMNACPNIP
jgi:hypothetical protein